MFSVAQCRVGSAVPAFIPPLTGSLESGSIQRLDVDGIPVGLEAMRCLEISSHIPRKEGAGEKGSEEDTERTPASLSRAELPGARLWAAF